MEQQTFALIYNNPTPNLAVLWPNWYEVDKQYLDENYNVITEYDIKNLGWSAWLVNSGQPFVVLEPKSDHSLTETSEKSDSNITKPKKKK